MTSTKAMLLAATAVVLIQGVAHAQTVAATTVADGNSLEDIIVTARKVSERIQDVPLSIQALSGTDVRDRQIRSIAELSQYTPGLTYSPDFGRTQERPVIRGISALRPEAPQPVSVFVNGVFVRDATLGLNLDDAARIEVIKGPQSALYGRSTYAGAINYATVHPGNELAGRAEVTIAGQGERTLFAAITLPVVKDVLSVRVRGKHYEYGGQYTNSQTGRKIGSERTNAVGGEVSWTPSPAFDFLGTVDWSKDRDGLFPGIARPVPIQAGGVVTNQNGSTNVANGASCNGRTINIVGNNATGIPDPAVPASLTTRTNGWPCGASVFTGTTVRRNQTDLQSYTDPATGIAYGNIEGLQREVLRFAGIANLHFGDGYVLTSLSAYTRQTANLGADQSYNGTRFAPGFGAPAASWLSYDRDRLNYGSQELRLASPQDRPFTWLVGAYFYREQSKGVSTGVIAQNAQFQTVADVIRPKSNASQRDLAGFARVQYAFGDRFKISAEGRYGEVQVRVGGTPLGIAKVTVGTCTAGQQCFINGNRTFKDFAPRVTADFKLTPDILLYAQVAKGTKSGGFNTTPGLTSDVFAYRGEKVWAYEAGIKSEFADRRLRVNVAGFWNDISDLQLSNISTVTSPFTGAASTTTIVNNVGTARTRGVELEVVARPAAWLTVNANYAFTDAKAIKGTETTNGTVFGGNRSVAGFELPRSPKHSATLGAEVGVPLGSHGLRGFVRGDLIYQSRRYAEIQNLIWADDFTHFNASVGLAGKGWRAVAFVKNAGDDNTSLNGFRYLDPGTFRRTAVDFLPRLRQFGGTFGVDF